jgi:hypothetical protein
MPGGTNVYATDAFKSVTTSVQTAQGVIDGFKDKAASGPLSELDMIEYNMAASRYSTLVSLGSGLVKNLTDTEKQVANKM